MFVEHGFLESVKNNFTHQSVSSMKFTSKVKFFLIFKWPAIA